MRTNGLKWRTWQGSSRTAGRIAAVAALVLAACAGGSDEPAGTQQIELPGERVFPEGITYDAASDSLFVGSTEDGTVYRVPSDADVAEVFLEGGVDGRTTVTGLATSGDLLLVAGRDSGRLFSYRVSTGELVSADDTATPGERTLLNDIAVVGDHAYVTDSFRPVLFRVALDGDSVGPPEPWIDLGTTPVPMSDGFNLNGITANADGTHVVTVHYDSGRLFAVELATGVVTEVDLGDDLLERGDGLEMADGDLLAVAGGDLVTVELSDDLATGRVTDRRPLDTARFPTTFAIVPDGLAIVNSQLDMTGADAAPVLPFTVTIIDPSIDAL